MSSIVSIVHRESSIAASSDPVEVRISPIGVQGPTGPSGGTLTRTADVTLSGHRVVRATSATGTDVCDAADASHLHGALGVSNEMPFMHMVTSSLVMGIADGPTEVHKVTLAKQVLKDYRPDNDLFPKYHIPRLREEAQEKFSKELAEMKEEYARRARDAASA